MAGFPACFDSLTVDLTADFGSDGPVRADSAILGGMKSTDLMSIAIFKRIAMSGIWNLRFGIAAAVLALSLAARAGLARGNWEPSVRAALAQTIEANRGNPDAYAVFDFDYTTAIGDLTYACMWHVLENRDFRGGDLEKTLAERLPEKYLPELRAVVARDGDADRGDFLRAWWALYRRLFRELGEPYAVEWRGRLFRGRDAQGLRELARVASAAERAKGVMYRDARVPSEVRGLVFAPEMKDLYTSLQEAGIAVYIVSGSRESMLKAVAPAAFGIPEDHIFGMSDDGTGGVATGRKPEFIRTHIAPRHHGAEPVLAAGDSMGDYAMFVDFPKLQRALVLLREPRGTPLAELVAGAEASNGRVLVQGRDEPRGCFVPSHRTTVVPRAGAPRTATFGGRPVAVRPVTLSACPLNQVWPGYQRPRSQTKPGAFVAFPVAEPGWLALEFPSAAKAEKARAALRIRPLSRTNETKTEGARLLLRVERPEQFVMEFPGVADDLHVFADPPAEHAATAGEIYFGPGVHEAGLIRPKSGQTVRFADDAYVYGCLFVEGVKDVRIVGRGVLDSSRMVRTVGDGRVLENEAGPIRRGEAPWDLNGSAFVALASTNLYVEGLVMVDAPFWAVTLRDCRGTVFDNVKLVGQWRYNADGFDVCDSSDTVIRNTFVRSFDDCIVARGAQLPAASPVMENLLVENCVLWCDWGKNLEVWGSGKPGTIRNVTYRKCKCIETAHIVADVTVQGGAKGIRYENFRVEDIEVDAVRPLRRSQLQKKENPDERYAGGERENVPLVVVSCNTGNAPGCDVVFSNMVFRNFRMYGEAVPTCHFLDHDKPGFRIENVRLVDMP